MCSCKRHASMRTKYDEPPASECNKRRTTTTTRGAHVTNKRRRIKTSYQKPEKKAHKSYDITSAINGEPLVNQQARVLLANHTKPTTQGWSAALLGLKEELLTPKQLIDESGHIEGNYTLKPNDLICYWALYCDELKNPSLIAPLPSIEHFGAGGTYTLDHVMVNGQLITKWTDLMRVACKMPRTRNAVLTRDMKMNPPWPTPSSNTWAASMRRAEAAAAADPDDLKSWIPLGPTKSGPIEYHQADIYIEERSAPIQSYTWTEDKKRKVNDLRRMMRRPTD